MARTNGKLTFKEDRFLDLYLFRFKGNGTQAAFEAYDCKDETVAGAIARENLQKPRLVAELNRRRQYLSENLTEEVILQNIAGLAFGSKSENIRTKNLELLARCKSLMVERVLSGPIDGVVSSQIDVNKVSTADLIDILQNRLRVSSKGVNTSQSRPENGPQSLQDHARDTISTQVESSIPQTSEQGKP